ncbi:MULTISPECIES: LacI family DNA-binding transcriptional regulator [unclassified Saccharopolyspora]|uniref:LacI family DNA-binding transcriptional regulator n=2 Tax=Saccharopolyspora TaxID=1835 RepID=UPI001CD7E0D5|nr:MULTISPECIES: LacI family DNA-binding transcriptional regulator [unclassified Saccharopolyspora]MCA1193959.1 LacI family transcriptional regulator [Saccharopolyspora sp. 6V]MCA1279310.1 LacI family transcriptional regulator [Saccharopolyspora sp. 7B]
MAATLTEVAKHAEVALSTASRAFSEPGRLGADTLRKVLAAAQELGYDPGRTRHPAPPRGGTVAVVVPDIANPVFGAFVKAAQAEGWHRSQTVLLADTAFDPDRERDVLAHLRGRADGIVVCSPRLDAEELLALCGRTPAVLVNRAATGVDCVLSDATDGLRQAVDYLTALGHRHLSYVQGSTRSWSNAHRLGIVTALAEQAGARLDVLGHQAETVAGGTAAAAGVLAAGATAVIAHNDLVALGVVSGARALGVHAPDGLSVVGFDDIPLAEITHPALTSIAAPIERAGAVSLELLGRAVAGQRTLPRTLRLPTQLVVRGTTGPVREETA